MGFLSFWSGPDIHKGLEEYDGMPDAVLLDVRTQEEYQQGHIPCSENISLLNIDQVSTLAENKDTPIFVYCRSGARSREAAAELQWMGYTHVKNIGGLSAYRGRLESGSGRKGRWKKENCLAGG